MAMHHDQGGSYVQIQAFARFSLVFNSRDGYRDHIGSG